MKSYTDIEQSKKLAEILPLESADMGYIPSEEDDNGNTLYTAEFKSEFIFDDDCCIACWSLAALLNALPYPSVHKHADETWWCDAWVDKVNPYTVKHFPSPIDACYEMILNLHEQKLL